MNDLLRRIYNIELNIEKWDSTAEFYETTLDITPAYTSDRIKYKDYSFGCGNTIFSLRGCSSLDDISSKNRECRFSIEVFNLNDAVEFLNKKKINITSGIQEEDGIRIINIHDPENNEISIIEIVDNNKKRINTDNRHCLIKGIYNMEVIIDDWENTCWWYKDVLQLGKPFFESENYVEFMIGSSKTFLALGRPPSEDELIDTKRRSVYFNFLVEKYRPMKERIIQNGYSTSISSASVYGKNVFEINIIDPENNLLGFIQPRWKIYNYLLDR